MIVIGVLAGGLCVKARAEMHAPLPLPVAFLENGAYLFLLVPVLWLIAALLVRNAPGISDDVKGLAFATGIALLIALGILVLYADLSPWLHLDWGFSAGDN
ncbi:MAG TPA: hypothetical protein VFV81_01195 [Verrucomicrobiae bacterium]|nr:hypothetical protein [Verrucomicrobiae bacterium]